MLGLGDEGFNPYALKYALPGTLTHRMWPQTSDEGDRAPVAFFHEGSRSSFDLSLPKESISFCPEKPLQYLATLHLSYAAGDFALMIQRRHLE